MTRAVLAVLVMLLPACQAGPAGDYPSRPGGGGPIAVGGGGSGDGDGGVSDGGGGAAPIQGHLCILKDLRHLTDCDTTQDASRLTVLLGTQSALAPPTRLGDFEVPGQLGSPLWHVRGATVITSVMPFGTDNTIPVVPETLYTDLLNSNSVTIAAEGEGSVVVRVVSGGAPAAGVTAMTTLVSGNAVPRYDSDGSAVDWREVGPTQTSGVVWFPGVQVTTSPARITLAPSVGTPVDVNVTVETLAIMFVTRDVK